MLQSIWRKFARFICCDSRTQQVATQSALKSVLQSQKEKRIADLQYHLTEKNAEILRWRRNSSSVTVKLMNEQLVLSRVLYMCVEAIYFQRTASLRALVLVSVNMCRVFLTNFHANC